MVANSDGQSNSRELNVDDHPLGAIVHQDGSVEPADGTTLSSLQVRAVCRAETAVFERLREIAKTAINAALCDFTEETGAVVDEIRIVSEEVAEMGAESGGRVFYDVAIVTRGPR